MTKRAAVTEAAIRRALQAVQKCGVPARVVIDLNSSQIIVTTGDTAPQMDAPATSLDKWMASRAG